MPASSSQNRFLICEATGFWAAAFRWQQPAGTRWPIESPASISECKDRLVEFPGSIVAIEARTDNAEELLDFLDAARMAFPTSASLVLLTPEMRGRRESLSFLEFGAKHVVQSPRRLDRLAPFIDRHLSAELATEAKPEDRVWERLPWPNH